MFDDLILYSEYESRVLEQVLINVIFHSHIP